MWVVELSYASSSTIQMAIHEWPAARIIALAILLQTEAPPSAQHGCGLHYSGYVFQRAAPGKSARSSFLHPQSATSHFPNESLHAGAKRAVKVPVHRCLKDDQRSVSA